jgi:hypothetical protein
MGGICVRKVAQYRCSHRIQPEFCRECSGHTFADHTGPLTHGQVQENKIYVLVNRIFPFPENHKKV